MCTFTTVHMHVGQLVRMRTMIPVHMCSGLQHTPAPSDLENVLERYRIRFWNV